MALLGESRGLGGEIKLFPPPIFKGEHERWEDWSWQLKAYVALYKPVAQELMTRVEGSASATLRLMTLFFSKKKTISILDKTW